MKMFEDVRRNLQRTSELRKLEYTFICTGSMACARLPRNLDWRYTFAQALWPVPGFLEIWTAQYGSAVLVE